MSDDAPIPYDKDLQFSIDSRMLHDMLLRTPKSHPGYEQLRRDYMRLHERQFGTNAPLTGGGASFNSRTFEVTSKTRSTTEGLSVLADLTRGKSK